MKFKKRKKEIFLGNLRMFVDEETEKELQPNVLVRRRLVEGTFFFHYADGSVEAKAFDEVVKEMVEDINRRDRRGLEKAST